MRMPLEGQLSFLYFFLYLLICVCTCVTVFFAFTLSVLLRYCLGGAGLSCHKAKFIYFIESKRSRGIRSSAIIL